jgi:preprotein translocase subunit SecE
MQYEQTNIEQMREAVRAKTAAMGLEKSKVSADYIQSKTTQAKQGGPPGGAGANMDPDSFGGLDLSQISDSASAAGERKSTYDETLPSMFYDPEDDLTKDEQNEVDPIRMENPIKQGLNELTNAKWPGPAAALREVVVLIVVVAVTGFMIIEFDQLLRSLYTTAGFIPSSESLAKYAARFDGLDLPSGWTNNMSDKDVSNMAEQVNSAPDVAAAAAAAAGSKLPKL